MRWTQAIPCVIIAGGKRMNHPLRERPRPIRLLSHRGTTEQAAESFVSNADQTEFFLFYSGGGGEHLCKYLHLFLS